MVLLCFSVGWYSTFVAVWPLTSHEVPTAAKYCSYDSPVLESCNYKMSQYYISNRTKQGRHFSLSMKRIVLYPLERQRVKLQDKKAMC